MQRIRFCSYSFSGAKITSVSSITGLDVEPTRPQGRETVSALCFWSSGRLQTQETGHKAASPSPLLCYIYHISLNLWHSVITASMGFGHRAVQRCWKLHVRRAAGLGPGRDSSVLSCGQTTWMAANRPCVVVHVRAATKTFRIFT